MLHIAGWVDRGQRQCQEQPGSLSSFNMGLSGGPGNTARKYVVLRRDMRGLSGSGV